MRRKSTSVSLSLNQAVALLIQNEAAFLARMAKADERMAMADQVTVEFRQRFESIERRLAAIETILRELPQALRREIGFKPQ